MTSVVELWISVAILITKRFIVSKACGYVLCCSYMCTYLLTYFVIAQHKSCVLLSLLIPSITVITKMQVPCSEVFTFPVHHYDYLWL